MQVKAAKLLLLHYPTSTQNKLNPHTTPDIFKAIEDNIRESFQGVELGRGIVVEDPESTDITAKKDGRARPVKTV